MDTHLHRMHGYMRRKYEKHNLYEICSFSSPFFRFEASMSVCVVCTLSFYALFSIASSAIFIFKIGILCALDCEMCRNVQMFNQLSMQQTCLLCTALHTETIQFKAIEDFTSCCCCCCDAFMQTFEIVAIYAYTVYGIWWQKKQ